MREGSSKTPAVVVLAIILIVAGVFFWSRGRGPESGAGRGGSRAPADRGVAGGVPGAAVGERKAEPGLPEGTAEGPATGESPDGESASAGGSSAGTSGTAAAPGPSSASRIPHQVVRSWGAEGAPSRVPGMVGMYVVVSPSISQDDLVKLAQDLLASHRNAKVLNVRILDSSEAATHDQHLDGGAMRAKHLVAEVRRNEMQESESIRIRGVEIDPKTGGPLPEKPPAQAPAVPTGN